MPTETLRTVCNRDCPDACGLIATVEDGRLVRLGGDPGHPVTKGFLCARTSQFPARQNSPDRLTTPLLRDGSGFRPVSWGEALSFAADRLLAIRAESGPAAILHYRSGGSLGLVKSVVDYFFELLGPVTVKRGDICSGAGDAAQETDFGDEESHDFFDLRSSKGILLWGKNPFVSNVHLLPLLKEAKARGARLVLIDPIRHKTAALADDYLAPRPGGDLSLALGVAALLFETGRVVEGAASFCEGFDAFRTLALSNSPAGWADDAGVPPRALELLAATLCERPCNIQVGWGMGRRTNGSSIVRALDALGALTGNLGIPGGGVSFYFKRRGAFDTSFLTKAWPRTLSEPLLGMEILGATDPPVRAVWVTAGNPVAMLPDSATVARALETRELVVVVDSFLTDTARRAHLVLPTTTLVEDDDLMGAYGHHWLGASVPVVAPPAEVKGDLEIVQLLAAEIDRRTGASDDAGNAIAPESLGSARSGSGDFSGGSKPMGVTVERLERESVRNPLAGNLLFEGSKFPTPSGKMRLLTTVPPPPEDEPGYPLWLFSNSTERAQSSQWAGPAPTVVEATCHPDAVPGLADGAEVLVESAIGSLRARLKLDALQRRDVVLVPKGGHFDAGTCANALVKARLTDAGEGAAYLDCRVRIRQA
ncbi:MAG: molybdopterin-dependent oxidoreductase [Holophagales bacterium]|nr:molybdopterin-dependent oxidoreductase [Holophagales bacterium]